MAIGRSVHRRQMAQKINRNLHGLDLAVDIVVVTEEDLKKIWRARWDNFAPSLEGRSSRL